MTLTWEYGCNCSDDKSTTAIQGMTLPAWAQTVRTRSAACRFAACRLLIRSWPAGCADLTFVDPQTNRVMTEGVCIVFTGNLPAIERQFNCCCCRCCCWCCSCWYYCHYYCGSMQFTAPLLTYSIKTDWRERVGRALAHLMSCWLITSKWQAVMRKVNNGN